MKIEFNPGPVEQLETDAIAVSLTEEEVKELSVNNQIEDLILQEAKLNSFKGEFNQLLFFSAKDRLPTKHIIVVGLGKSSELDAEKVRRAFATATKKANSAKIKKLHVLVKDKKHAVSITEGIVLTDYSFDKYKTDEKKKSSHLELLALVYSEPALIEDSVNEANTVCSATLLVRDIVNEPPNILNPAQFEFVARKIAKAGRLKITVLDQKQLEKKGLNLITNVGKGSDSPPRLIVLEYYGDKKSKEKIAFVGKGVTFDTGGMNLKPSASMCNMKYDMAGAGVVLGTLLAAAKLNLNRNIIGVLPIVENMIGKKAYRPDDIVKAYNGKTVEIANTDAEGRLILADALAFVEKNYRPTTIIDLATLTGACCVALGEYNAALISTDEHLSNDLFKAGQETGERVWRLPLDEEYKEEVKGEIADVTNLGYNSGKYAGTIIGAAFLKNFVETNKWAHIDIAGTAWYEKEKHYIPKNGTGFGVRLLINWLKNKGDSNE